MLVLDRARALVRVLVRVRFLLRALVIARVSVLVLVRAFLGLDIVLGRVPARVVVVDIVVSRACGRLHVRVRGAAIALVHVGVLGSNRVLLRAIVRVRVRVRARVCVWFCAWC